MWFSNNVGSQWNLPSGYWQGLTIYWFRKHWSYLLMLHWTGKWLFQLHQGKMALYNTKDVVCDLSAMPKSLLWQGKLEIIRSLTGWIDSVVVIDNNYQKITLYYVIHGLRYFGAVLLVYLLDSWLQLFFYDNFPHSHRILSVIIKWIILRYFPQSWDKICREEFTTYLPLPFIVTNFIRWWIDIKFQCMGNQMTCSGCCLLNNLRNGNTGITDVAHLGNLMLCHE